MARAGIIYSHVAAAAAQLVVAGTNPTVDSVREALGATGSKSTIGPLLKRWKMEHQKAVVENDLGVPSELLQVVKGIYGNLQANAQLQLEAADQKHRTALQALLDRMQQFDADTRTAYETQAALSTELAQTKDALAGLQSSHYARGVTLAVLQSNNANLQQRLTDRGAEVEALNQQLAQARIQFEHFQEATATQRNEERRVAEQHVARLEEQRNSLQRQLIDQRLLAAQQETRLTLVGDENNRLREQKHAARKQASATSNERDLLSYEIKTLDALRQELKGELADVRQALTQALATLAGREKEAVSLIARLDIAEKKVLSLEVGRLILVQDNATLRDSQDAKPKDL